MKRLLLLFIPLVFFFSCENEEEESADCSCGILTEIVEIPGFDGDLVPVIDPITGLHATDPISGDLMFEVDGAHDSYTIGYVENYCSGNIGTTCQFPPIGSEVCMEFTCDLIEVEVVVNGILTTQMMVTDTDIIFE